jgi:hypothetical protein
MCGIGCCNIKRNRLKLKNASSFMKPPPNQHEPASKPRITRSLISGLSGSTRARLCAHLAPTVNSSAVRGHSKHKSQLPAPTSLSQSDTPRARDTHADCITDWPRKGLDTGALKINTRHTRCCTTAYTHACRDSRLPYKQHKHTIRTQCKHAFAISSCQNQHTPCRRT